MSYEDEYFCPKCGAILNDQYGFDPNNGTWTCTECGQHLMDDDIYDGDTFEGVAWYCDECGALLNRQTGFSDSYGSWTCTECGHTNGITEEDIIDEDKICCPNCGADLSSEYSYDCNCFSCGVKLHRDYSSDPFEIIEDKDVEENEDFDEDELECPNCGAILNSQEDFDADEEDWTCTECGTSLHHDYSDEEYEIVEDDEDDLLEEKKVNNKKSYNYPSRITSKPRVRTVVKHQPSHSMNEYEYKLELEKLKIREREEKEKRERENKVRKIKIIASVILSLFGAVTLVLGFVLGEASGNSDSPLYALSMVGLLSLISLVFVWSFGGDKKK